MAKKPGKPFDMETATKNYISKRNIKKVGNKVGADVTKALKAKPSIKAGTASPTMVRNTIKKVESAKAKGTANKMRAQGAKINSSSTSRLSQGRRGK